MEATLTPPAEQPTDAAPAGPEASASEQEPQSEAAINASINDAIRGLAGIPPASTSTLDDPALAVTETASTPPAEPAPAEGDVSAGGDQPGPTKPGRRAAKAIEAQETIESLRVKSEQLEKDLKDAREQAKAEARAELAAEAAQSVDDQRFAETEARLQRLMAMPDNELSGEDYVWREDEKARRKLYAEQFPRVETHYRQQAQHQITSREAAFWADVSRQVHESANLPAVDRAELAKLPQWRQMAERIHADAWAGGAASVQAELDRLRAENSELKLTGPRGLGSARTAINGGRSDSAPPVDENDVMNGLFRALAGNAANR